MPNGTLEIFAIGARNLRNTELFVRMDPYLVFSIIICINSKEGEGEGEGEEDGSTTQKQKGVKRRTKAHVGGGRNPSWNQRSLLPITVFEEGLDGNVKLLIQCMDKDLVNDDLIGSAEIDLSPVIQEGSLDSWIDLGHPGGKKNKSAGQVRLVLTFHDNDKDKDYDDGFLTDADAISNLRISSRDVLENDPRPFPALPPPPPPLLSANEEDTLPISNGAYGPHKPIVYDRKIVSPPPPAASKGGPTKPTRPPPKPPVKAGQPCPETENATEHSVVIRSRKSSRTQSSPIDPSLLEITLPAGDADDNEKPRKPLPPIPAEKPAISVPLFTNPNTSGKYPARPPAPSPE